MGLLAKIRGIGASIFIYGGKFNARCTMSRWNFYYHKYNRQFLQFRISLYLGAYIPNYNGVSHYSYQILPFISPMEQML